MKQAAMLAAALLGIAFCNAALPQQYPAQPIRILVPVAAGGPTDILTRAVSPRFGDALGQQTIIDNRPGAGGTIATDLVAKAAPDGYTLLAADLSIASNPSLYKVSYNVRDSFSPVGLMALAPLVLVVNPALPVKNVKELIELARNQPGKLSYGAATATPTHFGPEVLKEAHGLDITFVPYKGIAPALVDLIGGRLTFCMLGVSAAKTFIESGKLRVLAITGTRRPAAMRDVPTFAESGAPLPDMDAGAWWGIVGPAGVPRDIVRRLHEALARALAAPDVRDRLLALNYEPASNTPEQFGAVMQNEAVKWARVIKRAGIRLD
jgi:tripartite-type tricarboxylate transporter receptor subunit TctC